MANLDIRSPYHLAYADNNKKKDVIKEILDIKFTHLTKISISENGIESIEGLVRIQMPTLGELFLSHVELIQSTTP